MRCCFLIPNRNFVWQLDLSFSKPQVPVKLACLITYPYFISYCHISLCQSTYQPMLLIHFRAGNVLKLCFIVRTCPSSWDNCFVFTAFMAIHLILLLFSFISEKQGFWEMEECKVMNLFFLWVFLLEKVNIEGKKQKQQKKTMFCCVCQ